MRFLDSILAGIVLNREAIQSDNFVTGISGWRVRKIGDAEFNNLTIRGTFSGNYFILSTDGLFFYSALPALGNMTGSWASAAGIDAYGNAYPAGLEIYSPLGSIALDALDGVLHSVGSSGDRVDIFDGTVAFQKSGDYGQASIIQNLGSDVNGSLTLSGGEHLISDRSAYLAIGTATTGNTPYIRMARYLGGQCDVLNDAIDQGRGVQAFTTVTANVALGTAGTEFTLMTLPSMTFVNGRAYRVDLWGLQQSTTTADTYFLHQFRKGTGIGGTLYKGQMRVRTLNATSTNNSVGLSFYLENTSGADITTTTTWTASCAAGTGGIFAASAGNQASATIVDVGLASQYSGQGVS